MLEGVNTTALPQEVAINPRSFVGSNPPVIGSRIPELDGLRGIAIALVVLFHYFYFNPGPDYHRIGLAHRLLLYFERFIAVGWSGVDLFFVLSGFLIGGILLDVRESPRYFKTFYLRRFYRIIPVYYVWILCYIVVAAVAGGFLTAHISHVNNNLLGTRYMVWIQFLFLQNFRILNSLPVMAGVWFRPTWSLAVEEQFYLIAPFVIRFFSKRALYLFLAIAILMAPALRLWIYYSMPAQRLDLGMIYTLMPCRADAIGIGILAALLWRNANFCQWLSSHGVALYGLAGFFLAGFIALGKWSPANDSILMQSVGYTWIALFYVLILLLALVRPNGPISRLGRAGWLRELGRVSYCLYLIHYGVRFICQVLVAATLKHVGPWEGIAGSCIAAVISYAIARMSSTYLEYPLLQKAHALKY
jgi:peptidoglycan/LPS O-acetylase OafA/YrhL